MPAFEASCALEMLGFQHVDVDEGLNALSEKRTPVYPSSKLSSKLADPSPDDAPVYDEFAAESEKCEEAYKYRKRKHTVHHSDANRAATDLGFSVGPE